MLTLPPKSGAADTLYKDKNTSNSKLMGYQIIYGLGIGTTLQNAIIACQTEVNDEDFIREYD
jgi:hypothetical protein